MVKFGFIATVLSLISCGNDFPDAPELKFCKLADGTCKSVHVFPKDDCETVGGEIVDSCKD
jgi:hypothetical protein